MIRSGLGLALLALLPASALGQPVVIEKATVPWNELVGLLRREGQPPPAPPKAGVPTGWSMTAQVGGQVGEGRARLTIDADVSVLAERWVVAPLLGAHLAVSSAQVESEEGRRGLLVRTGDGVAFAAEGPGRYRVHLEAEGELEAGRRLSWSPGGLAGGRARLTVLGTECVSGRSAWRIERGAAGQCVAQAALGANGLELVLDAEPAREEVGTTLEELRALTVVSLGGSGVTRLLVRALSTDGTLAVTLPPGATLWKAYVGSVPLKLASVVQGSMVRIPLRGAAQVELAYTFESPPMGLRGRWRVELPRLPVTVRDARWDLWLPEGLAYTETQAALSPASCSEASLRARTPLETRGTCRGFARAVLEPGRAWAEGLYQQPL